MNYFKLIQKNVDLAPLLQEIEANENAWLLNTSRQDKNKIHSETQTIALRSEVPRNDININDNQESEWKPLAEKFPLTCQFMEDVAKKTEGTLSRGVIVRLKPKSNVSLHIDTGTYYFIRQRYHLVLKSENGSDMMSGGEVVKMREGELWFFDNLQYHQAMNSSNNWRIHYIFDVLPNKYAELGQNPLTQNQIRDKLKAANLLKAKSAE